MQVRDDRENTGNYRNRCNRIGEVIVGIFFGVNHRVQDQADDSDDQENVLRDQDHRLVLHQQPEDIQERQA